MEGFLRAFGGFLNVAYKLAGRIGLTGLEFKDVYRGLGCFLLVEGLGALTRVPRRAVLPLPPRLRMDLKL